MKTYTKENQIYMTDEQGNILAEIDFPATEPGIVDINHTFVDEQLQGQHIAGKLVEDAVASIRQSGRKATVSCSYAQAWFKRHPDKVKDILLTD